MIAILMILAFVLQGTTSVLAGTTGAIAGSVVDASTNSPVSGARVTATSPSQSATTTTDASGRFSFISLIPDTYTISAAETAARDAASTSGVTVQADQTVNVSLTQPAKLKQIGSVTSRAAGALVKPGTTADVYSINAVTQDKASGVGGGGNLNSAWSAIATVPGVFITPNQTGYIGAAATISIRGGDYDQIGYELDGVPVNRAFDNYPSGSLSSLGQQELQVYTGATPANSEAEGISGYINQVIRTGTAPASRNLTLAIGTPVFYNKVAFEAGGANPGRTFSYYIGAGAYNQSFRYYDQYNGASLQANYGAPLATCPDASSIGCHGPQGQDYTNGGASTAYALGPYQYNLQAGVQDRDTVANFHFGLPRKDGNKDDIQLLFDNNFINNPAYDSSNDTGPPAYFNFLNNGASGIEFNGIPSYADTYTFTGAPLGTVLPGSFTGGGTSSYLFPQSPFGRNANGLLTCDINHLGVTNGCVDPDRRDAFNNNQSVVKLQYQHNFGTSAFLRIYGYTYYSNWLQTGPQSNFANYIGYVPSDYELSSHTRGLSVNFSDQLNSQHLLSVQGSYTTSSTLRDNNTQDVAGFYPASRLNGRTVVGLLVDSSNPLNGICYTFGGAPVPCYNNGGTDLNRGVTHGGTSPFPGFFNLLQAANGTVTPASGMCGGGPCRYLVVENGLHATYNGVVPKFSAFSITDQWKPTDRLNVNLGLRFDRFEFDGSDTTGSPARTFFYNAWNNQFPTLKQLNTPSQVEAYNVIQPRLGLTYTVDPRTVLRASYGRYGQAPNSAFEQYNFLQQDAPPSLANFVRFGVGNTPAHAIRPPISNNYDFSFEHQFKGDTSIKFTPFLRKTQDQIQQFFLDQKTSFVSGLNVGRQTSEGFELEVDKGDFSRNGLAARLSFTYTNSYINYSRLSNGLSVIDPFNAAISQYNTFTKNGGGSPCYVTATTDPVTGAVIPGAAAPGCPAGSIANPYYNAPTQPLMDVNGNYPTFDIFPGGIGAGGYSSFGAPYVTTLIVQYKHGPLSITPALQFSGGSRYGVPISTGGIFPNQCQGGLGGSPNSDPRYFYGAPGGAPYDVATCLAAQNTANTAAVPVNSQGVGADPAYLAIPNPYTHRFDGVGGFVSPSQILLHTQITYDVNKRFTLVGNFANIVNRCFGGTKVPFAVNHACNYTATYG
ncbi:MAG: TonB-dependent receptor, partial [Candidatus Eremiobacteraeota bacterium]|nr:TonB-dependent receptor [Candidatus Eremiobacteraeota bacterium]